MSGYGKSLVVCWTPQDSFDVAANRANVTQLGNLLKETLKNQTVRIL